ncbi:MAG: hypothetical protein WBO37_07305 [Gammaproteobacteria bacterium]
MKSPRILWTARAGLLVCLSMGTAVAEAVTVSSIGAGSAVSSIDRSANFDSITTNGISFTPYSEGTLTINTPGSSVIGFNVFADTSPGSVQTDKYYYASGNNGHVTITTSDGIDMFGVEFRVGHGFLGVVDTSVIWEAYSNNVLTGSGQFNTTRGSVIGWSDIAGFDELRVGANTTGSGYANFGEPQAIAIDDLNVQISAVPLPAAVWLFGSGILALIGIGRQRRQS